MGQVCQAVDTETGRSVAAKIMLASSDDNLDALLRFQQEGAVLSTLKHPNIVEVYGTFLEEHTSCIIMELLEGQSLSQLLRSEHLPLPRIKRLVSQVVSALVYAHGRAIVHRDIKPDNIMVVGDDHVKVTDFGIARILRSGGTLNTATGTSIGTPLYMAPEQIEGAKVDGRADIYSLGTVLYQMVTGQPPFQGDDPLTVAFKHVHKAPQPPSELNANVPEDWEGLILKCLAKDPGDRFQTAAALQEAMVTLGGGGAHLAPAPGVPGGGARGADTVDRILHPEVTRAPGAPAYGVTADRPAAAAAPVQTPPPQVPPLTMPGAAGAPTLDRGQPRPTMVRPTDMPSYASGETAMRVPPQPASGYAASAAPMVQPVARKGGVPVALVAGGIVALVAVIAVVAYFALHGSSSPKPAVITPPATPTIALSMTGSGSGGVFASGSAVRLSWSPVSKAGIYTLQVATSATDPSDTIVFRHHKTVLIDKTSYALHVIGAQFYYWRVRAQVSGAWTNYTPSKHFGVARPAIGRPAPLSPRNGSATIATSVQLCWSPVKGALEYRLRVDGHSQIVHGGCSTLGVHPRAYHWSVAAEVKGVQVYTGSFSARATFFIHSKPKPKATSQPTATPQSAAPTTPPYVAPTTPPYVAPTTPPYVAPTTPPYVAPTTPPYVAPTATPPAVCQISCG
jgi:hypothetical protein